MRPTRPSLRTSTLAITAAALAATALLVPASASAAQSSPHAVHYTAAQLAGVTSALNNNARIPGTAWAIDPRHNQVVVSVDQSVSGAKLDRLERVVKSYGSAVQVRHIAGTLHNYVAGGDAIYGGQYRCSLGFNVVSGGTYYFLTAGHCGNIASTWYADGAHTIALGNTVGSSFPDNDFAIVQYTGNMTDPGGTVDLYNGSSQDITTAADAYVGENVQRSGSTTGVHGGVVQALNATVNYAEGTVYGMIQTNVCAEGGDSGGSLFDGGAAIGLTSGGSGNCTTGGTTFFQPVTEALSVYGVSVY